MTYDRWLNPPEWFEDEELCEDCGLAIRDGVCRCTTDCEELYLEEGRKRIEEDSENETD